MATRTAVFGEESVQSMSKRRRGFPSEARVQRGLVRVVGGEGDRRKVLDEKVGRNDPCPCGSGRRFQALLPGFRPLGWRTARQLSIGADVWVEGGGMVRRPCRRRDLPGRAEDQGHDDHDEDGVGERAGRRGAVR